MVDKLTILTSIHILAAALWVGGAFTLNLANALIARHPDPLTARVTVFRLAEFIGLKVFVPLSLIVLASGIWLASDYYDFGDLWIVLSLITTVATVTIGAGYLGPQGRKALSAMESGGGAPPPGKRNWVPIVGRINTLLLVAILVIMVIKPT
jgi:uncharacterized membrane protein